MTAAEATVARYRALGGRASRREWTDLANALGQLSWAAAEDGDEPTYWRYETFARVCRDRAQ